MSAIIFSAIASWQNQVISLFTVYVVVKLFFDNRYVLIEKIRKAVPSFLIFVPSVFYFVNFGAFSPLYVAVKYESIVVHFKKIYEVFFDLNIGMAPYIFFALFLSLYFVIYKTLKQRKITFELQLFLVLLTMSAVLSLQVNWNSGTSGPMRYVIWMMPFIFFILVLNIDLIIKKKVLYTVAIIGLLTQGYLVIWGGFLVPNNNSVNSYIKHNFIASYVLDHYPFLYNPSPEIFVERTSHTDGTVKSAIYKSEGECKKALYSCESLYDMEKICGILPESIINVCQKKSYNGRVSEYLYFNF